MDQLFPSQDEPSEKEKNGRAKEHLDEKCQSKIGSRDIQSDWYKTQPDGGMLLVAFVPHGYHRLKPVGKNHRANSAKLDTKQPWENGIQGYLNEGPCHFSRGYKKKKRKYIYLAKVRNSFL